MKIFAGLLSYIAVVSVLVFGFAAGGAYLLQADPTTKAEARPRQIPQKILDSIERKKPVSMDIAAPTRLEPQRPAMMEAEASLLRKSAPRQIIREVSLPSQPKTSRKRGSHKQASPADAPVAPVAVTPTPVATGRSDFPY